MDIDKRIQLVKEVGEEIVTVEELRELFETKKHPIAYDGFEPSGTDIHIAQGLLRAININKMIKAGCKFKILVADWHAWANNKVGGDLEKIQKVGKYFVEVWKACGLDLDNVEFIWANDIIQDREYWKTVMQIAVNSTIKRIVRCGTILGRKESDMRQASQIFAPVMQAADIFHLKADITQLGMDQRKVNVIAREMGPKLGYWKPIMVSHHMLRGLGKPPANVDIADKVLELKMSKSKPDSAIFMTDSEDLIKKKLGKAYCPEGVIEENPVLEYCKYILFERNRELIIKRPEKWGGNLEFTSYRDLEASFSKKKVHPMDLKAAVAIELNELLEPIRKKLEKSKLREEIQGFTVTR